jgi:glycine cleavage system H lipoate-binding protein
VRKLILDGPGASTGGLCTSAEYTACSLVEPEAAGRERCPHLEEIHVQYCGAAPVAKLVPFSDSQSFRCAGDGYLYCDSYLARVRPHGTQAAPKGLLYAPNHLWLNASADGLCHVGIDGFLADTAGQMDGVTFVNSRGTHRPSFVLTVNGVEWPMLFPNPILIQGVNSKLKTDPQRLSTDPFGAGWLFEGFEVPGRTRAGLIGGAQAEAWLEEERNRLSRHVNDTQGLGADGGYAVHGVARLLSRPDVARLFQQFFARTEWSAEE